jgi:tetratricopeptide (TPR) repeat protein
MVLRRLFALVTLVLFTSVSPWAIADTAQDWESGKQAFAAGDFESALLYFEMARDAGQQGPAVHYNIAVCQFELGRYEHALSTFEYIAENYPDMRGLAEYNMGLAERRLGNEGEARQHFITAWDLSADDEKLRSMSAAMLEELEPEQPSNWYGAVALRFGHDDNIALRDSLGLPAGVTSESPMVDVFASLSVAPAALRGLTLDGSAYAIAYTDADDFDQSEFRLGGAYAWSPRDWWIETGAHFVYGTIGGSGFERELALSARAVRYLDNESSIDALLRYDDINEVDADFAGIAGSRQRFDLRYRRDLASHSFILRYGIETNDRLDPGVSPSRNRIHADYRFQPASGWGVEAGISYRTSDYDDLETPRTEDLTTITAALTRTIAEVWLFALQYQYSENDSNDPEFSYERNLITLGVLRTF